MISLPCVSVCLSGSLAFCPPLTVYLPLAVSPCVFLLLLSQVCCKCVVVLFFSPPCVLLFDFASSFFVFFFWAFWFVLRFVGHLQLEAVRINVVGALGCIGGMGPTADLMGMVGGALLQSLDDSCGWVVAEGLNGEREKACVGGS